MGEAICQAAARKDPAPVLREGLQPVLALSMDALDIEPDERGKYAAMMA